MIYGVYGKVVGSKFLGKVEADNKEEAEKLAQNLDTYIGLCHQCSANCEDAEVTEIVVWEDE